MTKIDFYILPETEIAQRINFACRLTEKAVKNNHRVLLAVDNSQDAEALDQALWAFKPESFIPHQIVDSKSTSSSVQVEINFNRNCIDHHDVLINLASQLPSYFSQFKRLAEIVIQAPEVLKSTRTHYTYYQKRGYPISHHKLG